MKRLWQIVVSLSVIVTLCATSFFMPVKADTYTIDDLWAKLNAILKAVDGYSTTSGSSNYDSVNYNVRQIELLMQRLFGQNGVYDYVVQNNVKTDQTFEVMMGDLLTQQNEILMSIVSSYVDASDPDNVIIKPGLFDKLDGISTQLSQSNGWYSTLHTDLASVVSDLNAIEDLCTTIVKLNEQHFYDFESFSAYHLFSKMGWDGTFDITNFNYPALDITTTPATDYSGSFNANKRFSVNAGDTVVVAFYCDLYLLQATSGVTLNSGNNRSIYWHSMSGSSQVVGSLIANETERVSNQGYLYKLFITNNSNSIQYISFDILFNGPVTGYVVPFYVGSTRFLSDRMQSIIQYDPDILLKDLQGSNNSWFERIYNAIIGDPDSQNQTQQDIDSMNDKVSDIQDSLDDYSDRLDQNIDDVDPSSLWSNINSNKQGVNFLSGVVHSVYSSFGSYSWLLLLPLILGLIILFMG